MKRSSEKCGIPLDDSAYMMGVLEGEVREEGVEKIEKIL